MKSRFLIILTVFAVLSLFGQKIQAQTSVNSASTLYDALNDETVQAINLTGNVQDTLKDEYNDYIDFDLDQPIEYRTVTIKSNGRSIAYKSKDGDDRYIFYIPIADGGKLEFTDGANISGGYSNDLGVIFVDGGTLTFNGDAQIHDNIGGGVVTGSAVVNFNTVTLNKNTATSDGGGLYLYDSQTTVTGEAKFTNNKAGYDSDDTPPSFNSGLGGAVYIYDGTLNFQSATSFGEINETTASNGNIAADDGGALYIDSNASVTFSNTASVSFGGNSTQFGNGGAVYLGSGTLTFGSTTKFLSNKSLEGNGGAMSISDGVLNSNGTTDFINNEAAVYGGAIHTEFSTLQFADVTFTGNKSLYENVDEDDHGGGGAIFADDSTILFQNSATFRNNSAEKGSGGALFVYGSGDNTDEDNLIPGIHFQNGATISDNKAIAGGAFYVENSVVLFEKTTTISSNTSTNGGAFYAAGDSTLQFGTNSVTIITGNTATEKGGAIMVSEGANLTLKTESGANLTIDATTGTAKNDVFIDESGTLTLNVASNGQISIKSALSSTENGADIIKKGGGTVDFSGNASGYSGNLTINEGNFSITGNGSTFGNLDSTVITVDTNAQLVVQVDDNTPPPPDDMGLLRVSQLDLVDGKLVFTSQTSVMGESDANTGYALLTLNDPSGYDILEEYVKDGYIISGNSLPLQYRIDSDPNGDFHTLFVWVEFDPNNKDTEWTFNQTSGTLNLGSFAGKDYTLNNTNSLYPDNESKGLTVNGVGTVKLTNSDNKVNWLEGDGNLDIPKSLEVNGATLGAIDTKTYTGTLNGDGTFTKKGGYTQVLTGNNSNYTGSMTVEEGTLRGNSNSLVGGIKVEPNGTLEFNQKGIQNGTFTGSLSGGGNLLINGDVQELGASSDSVLVFKGNNTFTGKTIVNTGWLVLDEGSNFSKTDITINENGGFGGTGHVQSVYVKNGGAVQAYKGILTIDNELKFENGGKMYVFVDPADIGGKMINNDYINAAVGSTVDFTGAKIEIVGIADGYTEGTSFQLTTGNVAGLDLNQKYVYEDKINNQQWEFTFGQDNDGNYIATGKIIGPGPDPKPIIIGLAWNQSQVAASLEMAAAAGSGATPEMKEFITKLNTFKSGTTEDPKYDPKYLDATKQLAGAIRANGIQLGLYSPYRTVFNRLSLGSELYGGSSPTIYNDGYGPISGFQYRGAGTGETYRGQYEQTNPHCIDEAPTCDIPCYMGENNFWADITHVQTKTRGNDNSSEYGISRTGLLIGLDVQKKMNSRVGFLFGYFAPYLWQDNDRVEADDYHAGMYLHKNNFGTDIYGYFGYAHQEYESRRFVDMSAIGPYGSHRYNGKTSGDSFSMSIEISKPRYYGSNLILRPLIGLDYLLTSQKGYSERGDNSAYDLFGLQYNRSQYDQLFVRLGMNLKRETFRSTTNFRIQYINQFATNPYPDGNARLLSATDAGTNMSIRGVNLGRDYLNLGVGLNLFMNEARSRFVSFDYDLNTSKKTTAHGLSLILVERF